MSNLTWYIFTVNGTYLATTWHRVVAELYRKDEMFLVSLCYDITRPLLVRVK